MFNRKQLDSLELSFEDLDDLKEEILAKLSLERDANNITLFRFLRARADKNVLQCDFLAWSMEMHISRHLQVYQGSDSVLGFFDHFNFEKRKL